MRTLDWIILVTALLGIVAYGVWKGRGSKDLKGYLLADRSMKWYTIAFSIMATQASAITFLSTPGQGFVDGMRFVQFYFGLPLAAVILSVTAIPLYHRLKVFTAYQFLEGRFDMKTRALAALLFLVQRGLAAGLTIFAPALILSVILGWNLHYTNFGVGILVIIYTASGGTRAVNWTQFHQMVVILSGMVLAFFLIIYRLPADVSFMDATHLAGSLGRLNAIDFTFDLKNRYNIWSGLIAGGFLALSYFGTDQSQVARYLTGKSITHSRMGLLFNGIVKVPMQFFILFLGVMVLVFYQFEAPPVFFNQVEVRAIREAPQAEQFAELETSYRDAFDEKRDHIMSWVDARRGGDPAALAAAKERFLAADEKMTSVRSDAVGLLEENNPGMASDTNYVFLTFVVNYLPAGVVGLLIAAIMFASMSSTSSELNALASTTVIDIYGRLIKKQASDSHYLAASKAATVMWGVIAIAFAESFRGSETLVEAVNIIGSLFYGTILGIFLAAFYLKALRATSVFIGAWVALAAVFTCHILTEMGKIDIGYLWYNVIGCVLVILVAFAVQPFVKKAVR